MRRCLVGFSTVLLVAGALACATVGPPLPAPEEGTPAEGEAEGIVPSEAPEGTQGEETPAAGEGVAEGGGPVPPTDGAAPADAAAADNPFAAPVDTAPVDTAPVDTAPPPTGDTAGLKAEFAAAREQGDWGTAEQKLLSVLRAAPEDADALYDLAVVQSRLGRAEEAAGNARKAFEKKPELAPAGRLLIALLVKLNRADQAVGPVEAAIAARPKDVDVASLQIELSIARHEWLRAIETARSLLKQDETNISVMKSLGRTYFLMGKHNTAEFIFKRALELEKDDAEILYYLALIGAKEERDKTKILALYGKVVTAKPDFPEALNNIGLVFYETRNYEQAKEKFEEALRYAPEFREARLNLANSLRGMRLFDDADKVYADLAQKYPDFAPAYFNRGLMYLESEMGGLEREPRLLKAVEFLRQYKDVSGRALRSDDPAEEYIREAISLVDELRKAKDEEIRLGQEQEAKFARLQPATKALIADQMALRQKLAEGMEAWQTAGNLEKVNAFQELLTLYDEGIGSMVGDLASAMENKLADDMESLFEEIKTMREEFQPAVDDAFSEPPPETAPPMEEPAPGGETPPVEEGVPGGETPPVEEGVPGGAAPAEGVAPPPDEAWPFAEPAPAEEPLPVEEPAPSVEPVPVEEPLPAEEPASLEPPDELPLEPVE